LNWNRKWYTWLENNAWKYWFLKSYSKECQNLTWINKEDWHYRWVGKTNAQEFMKLKNKVESEKKWNIYCPISYFRLKSGKWPVEIE
jgi:hypothetical protein